jgi:hypothetical protein
VAVTAGGAGSCRARARRPEAVVCRTGTLGQVNYRHDGWSGRWPRAGAREPRRRKLRVRMTVGPTDSDVASRDRMAARASRRSLQPCCKHGGAPNNSGGGTVCGGAEGVNRIPGVSDPDSGSGRPGFRVWATRASGRACSEHGVGTWSGTYPVKPLHEDRLLEFPAGDFRSGWRGCGARGPECQHEAKIMSGTESARWIRQSISGV